MADSNSLEQMILQLIEQKTFSLDALDAIKKLRDRAREQEEELLSYKDTIVLLQEKCNKVQNASSETQAEITKFRLREQALESREKTCFDLEKSAAVNAAIATTLRESFSLVFRNNIVREITTRGVITPSNLAGGMPNTSYVTDTSTKEVVDSPNTQDF